MFLNRKSLERKKESPIKGKSSTRSILLLLLFGLIFGGVMTSYSLFSRLNSVYLENAPSVMGNADVVLLKQSDNDFYNFNFDESIQPSLSSEFTNIQFVSRLYLLADTFPSMTMEPYDQSRDFESHLICGIDSAHEAQLDLSYSDQYGFSRLGNLWVCQKSESDFSTNSNLNYSRTEERYVDEIRFGHCLITKPLAIYYNLSAGCAINIGLIGNPVDLIIDAVVENDGRFPESSTGLIITDLFWLQYMSHLQKQINLVIGIFDTPEDYYNLVQLDLTLMNLQQLSEDIQECSSDLQIFFPRLLTLSTVLEEITSMVYVLLLLFLICLIFLFLTLWLYLSELFESSPLESAFSKTTTLGGHTKIQKSPFFSFIIHNHISRRLFSLVVTSSVSFGISGLVVEYAFQNYLIWEGFLIAFLKILGIILGLSLIGIVVIYNRHIHKIRVDSLNKINTSNKTEKIGNSKRNYRTRIPNVIPGYLYVGGFLSFISLSVMLFLPQLLLSPDILITGFFLVGLFLSIIVGLVILGSLALPWVRTVFFHLFKWLGGIFSRKQPKERLGSIQGIQDILQKGHGFLKEKWIILFSLLLLVGFSSFRQIQMANLSNNVLFHQGADMVIYNQGIQSDHNYLNISSFSYIQSHQEVESAAPILMNYIDAHAYDTQDFSIDFSIQQSDISTNTFDKPSTIISDLSNMHYQSCGIIGLNASYLTTIDPSLILWDETSSSALKSFDAFFTNPNACIISKSLAQVLNIVDIPTKVLLTLGETSYSEHQLIALDLVGISTGMPGFDSFYSASPFQNGLGGMLINLDTYLRVLNYTDISDPRLPIDKILVNFKDTTQSASSMQDLNEVHRDIADFTETLQLDFQSNYRYIIQDPLTTIGFISNGSQILDKKISYVWIFLGLCALLLIFQYYKVFHNQAKFVSKPKSFLAETIAYQGRENPKANSKIDIHVPIFEQLSRTPIFHGRIPTIMNIFTTFCYFIMVIFLQFILEKMLYMLISAFFSMPLTYISTQTSNLFILILFCFFLMFNRQDKIEITQPHSS